MKNHRFLFLKLALRLMKKQKLRTGAVFCGILLSSFLLHAFCGLGCSFLKQVYGPGTESASYNSSRLILTALAALLLIIVFSCSAVFLHNLFSLTVLQKRQNFRRLLALGACRGSLLFMAAAETGILFGTAAPIGSLLAFISARLAGNTPVLPSGLAVCIYLWLAALSFCYGLLSIRPAAGYAKDPCLLPISPVRRMTEKKRRACTRRSFASFMAQKYRSAGRRYHRRITAAITASLVLYVPAAYLIHTNLQQNASGLHAEYGIAYSCLPADPEELQASIAACRILLRAAAPARACFYVRISGTASLPAALLSSRMLASLKKAGWEETETFQADSEIYFLEDRCFASYAGSCLEHALPEQDGRKARGEALPEAILINRYTNRTLFRKDSSPFFLETDLLHADGVREVNQTGHIHAGRTLDLNIYCGIADQTQETLPCISPDACSSEFPAGIRSEKAALILPFHRMSAVCRAGETGWMRSFPDLFVCGQFADTDETLFPALLNTLPADAPGNLRYVRREYQAWYDSLHEIHLALLSICSLLFFTALLNVFGTMLFQCMHRKHGTAVLWSLGQTRQNLAAIIILESLHSFRSAMLTGIPLSCILCYAVYRIYRPVWQIPFTLPSVQLLQTAAAAVPAAAAAAAVSRFLLNRQDFLQEIRRNFL